MGGEDDTSMISIQQLETFDAEALRRLITGYRADARYVVNHQEAESEIAFTLRLVPLDRSYIKRYDYLDEETRQRYQSAAAPGYCFGAYDGDLLVGIVLAEPHWWNNSLWVWEFHVAETHRRQGIGRRLMETVAEKSKKAGLRTIVCETQTTNTPAIQAYRKLGFRIEGIDISYYTNQDYPDGEVAIFMKRRLGS
jgi:ribosomal protein S18 acetylase RimI-like enzyme